MERDAVYIITVTKGRCPGTPRLAPESRKTRVGRRNGQTDQQTQEVQAESRRGDHRDMLWGI